MSIIITYPFDNPANYTFDSNKVAVSAGESKLKLIDNPGQDFTETFDSDVGFTYDNTRAEFTGGLVRQIDKRPANATFYSSYNTNIDGNWGDGTLTGTAFGGAAVSSGKLDLKYSDIRYVSYPALNNVSTAIQQGCIRLRYTPNYTTTPLVNCYLFNINTGGGTSNLITLLHATSGVLYLYIYDSANNPVVTASLGIWSPTASIEYELEVNYEITTGSTRLFINGTQFGATGTGTGTRSAPDTFYVGTDNGGNAQSNFEINDLLVFDTPQHTTDYTPDWSDIYEYEYIESVVELPQFVYPGIGIIQGFTNIVTVDTNAPQQIWNDLYWNGSIWTSSNGTFAQSNTVADILTNIATFPVSDTLDIDIVFSDNNSTQMSIGNLIATYTGQIYPIDNPTVEIAQSFRLEELINFVETSVKTGSDEIKYILKKDSDWYYWNGSSWVVSDETYIQSNAAIDIVANIASFVSSPVTFSIRFFLHSNDGTTTPSIQELSITYDFAGAAADSVLTCAVYWYSRNPDNTICAKQVQAIISSEAKYKNNISVCKTAISTDPNITDGYTEINLIENVNMVDLGGKPVTYLISQGDKQIANISVPEQSGAVMWDIRV